MQRTYTPIVLNPLVTFSTFKLLAILAYLHMCMLSLLVSYDIVQQRRLRRMYLNLYNKVFLKQ